MVNNEKGLGRGSGDDDDADDVRVVYDYCGFNIDVIFAVTLRAYCLVSCTH